MSKVRTIRQAVAEIRKADPETAVTEYAIRQLVKSGQIPAVMSGNKALVNLDDIVKVFGGRSDGD